jgi:hypothetical protein
MNNNVYMLSKKFREAIEVAKEEGLLDSDPTLKNFPRGCCGSGSSLLAKFLYENGVYTYEINATKYGETSWDNQSHTWLMLENNYIIDITGDQFRTDAEFLYYSEKVYYGKMDDFHLMFDYDENDINKYDDCTLLSGKVGKQYLRMFKAIVDCIED